MKKLFIVQYSGPFGFIKPWTAVRDGETFSQQFLTPATIEGIEKKLFPETLPLTGLQGYILGHRLNYTGISRQQEQTWSKAWIEKRVDTITEMREVPRKGKKGGTELKEVKIPRVSRRPATGILTRGVLIEPNLSLAFASLEQAQRAAAQHICLSRNEDVLFPEAEITEAALEEWQSDVFPGFELIFNPGEGAVFKVGYNRFQDAAPMFGKVVSYGDPIRKRILES